MHIPPAYDLGFNIFKLDLIALDGADPCAAGACAEQAEECRGVLALDADAAAADGVDMNGAVCRYFNGFCIQKSANL